MLPRGRGGVQRRILPVFDGFGPAQWRWVWTGGWRLRGNGGSYLALSFLLSVREELFRYSYHLYIPAPATLASHNRKAWTMILQPVKVMV